MNISFENAKNASPTCVVDGRFLHSKYNPENEANTFVANIECNFNPSCIIITGTALPYCEQYLKIRFPNIPIVAIVYNSVFMTHGKWEKCFLCTANTTSMELSDAIFSQLGELHLGAVLTLSWKPSESLFEAETTIAWQALRALIQKTRDIIATRSYFAERWLKNSVRFCRFAQNIITIEKQVKPIVLVASGASLQESISHIAKHKDDFYIIAASSAICTLTENGIIPDMCISTDGGFYARNHLEVLINLHKSGVNIPLAISTESNVPTYVLENCPIIPLTYNDGIESELLHQCEIPAIAAERNGTVTGTASILAMKLTDEDIYTCGLDLANGSGYSHAQPNAHEKIHSQKDFRLCTLETRICPKPTHSSGLSSMDIYRQWFETRNENFSKRFFRVSKRKYSHTIGSIKNITWDDINCKNTDPTHIKTSNKCIKSVKDRKIIIEKFFDTIKMHDEFLQEIAIKNMF